MALRSRFNPEKAVEILLYVAARVHNMYAALKIIYFADKEHLSRYGRQLCGESYVAMDYGPVPSGLYDLVKAVRGDGYCLTALSLADSFAVDGRLILPKRSPNLDLLSDSDIECLDEALTKYGDLSFDTLKRLGHRDQAFRDADRSGFMSLESIVMSLPDGKLLLEHLNDD
jgi:uncharacterized phage-associated protein